MTSLPASGPGEPDPVLRFLGSVFLLLISVVGVIVFLIGRLGRLDFPLGLLIHAHAGFRSSLLNSFGLGLAMLGLGLALRRFKLLRIGGLALVLASLAVVALGTLTGPWLSDLYHRWREKVTWDRLTGRSDNDYRDWAWEYLAEVPRQYQRPEVRPRAFLEHARLSLSNRTCADLIWVAMKIHEHYPDSPEFQPSRLLALQGLRDRVAPGNAPERIFDVLETLCLEEKKLDLVLQQIREEATEALVRIATEGADLSRIILAIEARGWENEPHARRIVKAWRDARGERP